MIVHLTIADRPGFQFPYWFPTGFFPSGHDGQVAIPEGGSPLTTPGNVAMEFRSDEEITTFVSVRRVLAHSRWAKTHGNKLSGTFFAAASYLSM